MNSTHTTDHAAQQGKQPDRSEFRSPDGIARWWGKDGAWHILLPCEDPDPKTGLKTGGFRYTFDAFNSREEAIHAIEEQAIERALVNNGNISD